MIMAAAVLWGLIGPFSVWAAREGLTALATAFWRTALSAVPFALLAARYRAWPEPRELAGIAGFGVVGIAVMYAAFFIAVQQVGVGIAAVLLYTGPAWVGVFQWAATHQALSRSSLLALLLTIAGVVMVSLDPARVDFDWLGVVAGLISGIAYATHFTVARRYIAQLNAPLVYAIAMTVAAVVLAPIAEPRVPSAGAIVPLLFLSFVATFVASLLFARGVVAIAPVRAAITATVEPVVATVASMLLLDASLHAQQLLGAALVLTGVTIIVISGVATDRAAAATA